MRARERVACVAITGCSGSGKTTLAESVCMALSPTPRVAVLSLDAFYRADVSSDAEEFESPSLFDFARVVQEVEFKRRTHGLVLLEGIAVLAGGAELMALVDGVVLLESDPESMLQRRLLRDAGDATRFNSRDYWERFVWPLHMRYMEEHVEPLRRGSSLPWINLDAALAPRDGVRRVCTWLREHSFIA